MPHPQILAFGYHFFLGENKCWGVGVCGGGGGGGGLVVVHSKLDCHKVIWIVLLISFHDVKLC